MPAEAAIRAKNAAERAHQHLLVALKYIPDEKLDWVPMGEAKTPRQIALQCASTYTWAAGIIRGENKDGAFGELKPEEYPTREKLLAVLNDGWADLAATLATVTEEQLGDKRQLPWGEDTIGGLLPMAEWHSVWHTGQLNYIQTLLGDREDHWE